MLTLKTIRSPKGANKKTKRLGRGQASGQGTQAGKGHKGQKARKSGHVRLGFEGNNNPLFMRLPKRGFKNAAFKTEYAIISLSDLESKIDAGDVTKELLCKKGLLKGAKRKLPVKILGDKKITKSFNFVGIDKFSKTAQELVSQAGGKISNTK